MFDQFSEGARKVVLFARFEVSTIGGDAISAGHIVLGLLRVSPYLFENPEELRKRLELQLEDANRADTSTELPLTASALEALQLAIGLAKGSTVEPEHILDGIRQVDPGLLD